MGREVKKKKVRKGEEILEKKSGKKPLILAIVVLVIVFTATQIRSISLHEKQKENQIKIEQLQNEIAKEEDRQKELENYEVYIKTKEFVIDMAREKLGLIFPDEILILPK